MYIPPPLLLVIAVILSYLASQASPALAIAAAPFSLVGALLVGVGLLLFIWSVSYFRTHKTTLHPREKPKKLITSGPYRITRNPIYLAFLCISLGFALIFSNVLAIIGPILFFFFISMFIIPFEEHMLMSAFGNTYKAYRSRTKRWL